MMKRLLCAVLMSALIGATGCLAEDTGPVMTVVQGLAGVPLWEAPSQESAQLLLVPSGAYVTDCVAADDGFRCCTYDGKRGYIATQHLTDLDDEAERGCTALDYLPDLPSYEALCATGSHVLQHRVWTHVVVVQRAECETHEEIMAVCYDAGMKPVWQVEAASSALTELTMTDAFISGTQLVIFVAGQGFQAYEIGPDGACAWTQTSPEAQQVSGSICWAVGRDGRMYVCGAEDPAPICLDESGALLWQAEHQEHALVRPWRMVLTGTGLDIYDDSCPEEDNCCDVVSYDWNGKLIHIEQKFL